MYIYIHIYIYIYTYIHIPLLLPLLLQLLRRKLLLQLLERLLPPKVQVQKITKVSSIVVFYSRSSTMWRRHSGCLILQVSFRKRAINRRAHLRKVSSVVVFYSRSSTGWRRHIGFLKLQVSFRKRAMNHRAHLQKRTYKDKASYGSSPPCTRSLELNLILISHFPQKSPTIDGSFAERDLQLEASYGSSPPCNHICQCVLEVLISCMSVFVHLNEWRRPRMPYLYQSFSAKEPYD